jgi:hypothetical protein
MLDRQNPSVLSYVRLDGHGNATIVELNMTPTAQTIALNLSAAGLKPTTFTTVMASPAPISAAMPARTVTLAPFGAWVATVQ